MARSNPQTVAELARLDAIEATTWPPRIDRALTQLANARSPLHSSSGDSARASHSSDPTTRGETHEMRRANTIRSDLIAAIKERDRIGRRIRRILDEWAPEAAINPDTIWCVNCLLHGYHEPRGSNGTILCRWCADIQAKHGKRPNRRLLNLHLQGRYLDEATIRRLLKKDVAC